MKLQTSILVMLGTMVATPAFADAELANKKMCMACHTVDSKAVGPSFKEIAAKYAGNKDAPPKLVNSILKGSTGTWGNAVMIPMAAQVSEAEAKKLVDWILTLK